MPRSVEYSQMGVTYRPAVVGEAPSQSRRELMRELLAAHAAPVGKRILWRVGYVSALYDIAAILRRLVIGVPASDIADAIDERAEAIQRREVTT